jgi:ArsR family transcriptional regulator, virulence genes transcriptional regulator
MPARSLSLKARADLHKAEKAARVLRTLSHAARLNVLCELGDGERSAGELVNSSGLSQSALSQHLARLRDDGLVGTRRDGQTIYYFIADTKALHVVNLLYELYCRSYR